MEQILDTGFFQRIVLYPRYISIDDRKENELKRANRFGVQITTKIDETELAKELSKIGEKYITHEIKVDPKCYPLIRSEIDKMYKDVESAHERVREIMATFVPRYDNLMYIFAFHHSAAHFKDVIDIEDIRYGADLMRGLFAEVMSWVEENIALVKLSSKEQSVFNSVAMIYQQMDKGTDGYVPKVALMMNCHKKWGMSMNTIKRYFDKFKGFRKMIEIKGEKGLMVKLDLPEVGGKKK